MAATPHDMIKLGLGSTQDSALRSTVEELLTLLVELISAYHEAGDIEIVATLEERRRELAEAADDGVLAVLAESALEAARAAVARACDRQSEQHAELARFVALVRDTVTVLGEGQDPSTDINKAADRFDELLEIKDFAQLKSRLSAEVTGLRKLAEERQRQWREATEMFMTKVAVLESQLAGVREEAALDPLTKIGNRRHFEASLAEQLRMSKRQFVVALFDLDNFKQINDTHGHVMGDKVLVEMGLALKTSMRPGDLVARIGGDEFAAIAPGLTLRQSEARMQSVLGSIAKHLAGVAALPPVTMSCGVAECSAGDTSQSLIGRADQALYDAKRKGKNRIAVKAVPFIRDLLGR